MSKETTRTLDNICISDKTEFQAMKKIVSIIGAKTMKTGEEWVDKWGVPSINADTKLTKYNVTLSIFQYNVLLETVKRYPRMHDISADEKKALLDYSRENSQDFQKALTGELPRFRQVPLLFNRLIVAASREQGPPSQFSVLTRFRILRNVEKNGTADPEEFAKSGVFHLVLGEEEELE